MKWIPFGIIFIVLFLDQGTKILVVKYLKLRQSVNIIGDFVQLRYIENKGMAFGLFSDIESSFKHVIFIVLMIFAIGVVVYYYRTVNNNKVLIKSSFALILGGALGNLTDKVFGDIVFHQNLKLFYAKVIDFITIGIGQYRWPTFNLADIAITLGVFILLYSILLKKENEIFTSKANN